MLVKQSKEEKLTAKRVKEAETMEKVYIYICLLTKAYTT